MKYVLMGVAGMFFSCQLCGMDEATSLKDTRATKKRGNYEAIQRSRNQASMYLMPLFFKSLSSEQSREIGKALQNRREVRIVSEPGKKANSPKLEIKGAIKDSGGLSQSSEELAQKLSDWL